MIHRARRVVTGGELIAAGVGTAALGRPGYINLGRARDLPAARTPEALFARSAGESVVAAALDTVDRGGSVLVATQSGYAADVLEILAALSTGELSTFSTDDIAAKIAAIQSATGQCVTAIGGISDTIRENKKRGIAAVSRPAPTCGTPRQRWPSPVIPVMWCMPSRRIDRSTCS